MFFGRRQGYHQLSSTEHFTLEKFIEYKEKGDLSGMRELARSGDIGAISHLITYFWEREKYIECLYLDVKAFLHKDIEPLPRSQFRNNILNCFDKFIKKPEHKALLDRFKEIVTHSKQEPVPAEELDNVILILLQCYTSKEGLIQFAKDGDALCETCEKIKKSIYAEKYVLAPDTPDFFYTAGPDSDAEGSLTELKEPIEQRLTISQFLNWATSSSSSSSNFGSWSNISSLESLTSSSSTRSLESLTSSSSTSSLKSLITSSSSSHLRNLSSSSSSSSSSATPASSPPPSPNL